MNRLHTLWKDVLLGARFLRRNPAFSVVAIVALALGIGANTAVFSGLYGIVLKPLPFDREARLVELRSRDITVAADWQPSLPAPVVDDVSARSSSLDHVSYSMAVTATLAGGSTPEAVDGTLVSGNYFAAYGVVPALGRYIVPSDVTESSPKVVVLSYESWRRTFGGDPDILGTTLDVGIERPSIIVSQTIPSSSHTVIGVMPERAQFPVAGDVWLPFVEFTSRSGHGAPPRNMGGVVTLASLREGWTLPQAREELRAIARGLAEEHPSTDGNRELTVVPLTDAIAGPYKTGLLLLLGAVTCILTLACVNVGSLLIARSGARRRDVAIRQALGASRGRILQQFLCESLLLAAIGGVVSIVVAFWSIATLRALAPAGTPRLDDVTVSGPVLLYALGTSIVVGIIVGIVPAVRLSAPQLWTSLKSGRSAAGAARVSLALPFRVRSLLIGAQVALAVVLAVGAALAAQSLGRLLSVDLGLRTDRVVTMDVGLSAQACAPFERCVATLDRMVDGVTRVHGVTDASVAARRPFSAMQLATRIADGAAPASATPVLVAQRMVTPGYFGTLDIHVQVGRTFNRRDDLASPLVAVISESLSRRMFGGQALGQRVTWHRDMFEIVGVVGDVRDIDPSRTPEPTLYVPFAQGRLMPRVSLLVRTTSDPASVIADVRRAIVGEDSGATVGEVRMLDHVVAATTANPSFQAWLLGAFAIIGTLLAIVGTYGLVSYMIAVRAHEFGVRMALGGTSRDMTTLVMREGAAAITCGLAAGGLVSLALGRILRGFLYEVAPTDIVVVAGVALVLSAAAMMAYYGPTRAVARLNPASVLRDE